MSHKIISHAETAVHLRADSVSGGKDWVGAIDNAGNLHSYWGKTGNISNHASKKVYRSSAFYDLVQEKLAKGYKQIDAYTKGSGWESVLEWTSLQEVKVTASSKKPVTKDITAGIEAPQGALDWDF